VPDRIFPFSAIVGQESMKLALILSAIHRGIHGVLISGARGTAKSTAARSLAALLPTIRCVEGCPMACDPDQPAACCPVCSQGQSDGHQELQITERATPFVSLPLGATEDRVTGTIDLEQALTNGNACFDPGVLAKAHRGVLYIDEVNLLPDHLVDLLLDVAATGIHHVEREGVSVTHPARFMLVGTMNPDEGELRPQLLDRFGLSVGVEEFPDPVQRGEVVRRALAFEADPESFLAAWKGPEEELRLRLETARQRLGRVNFPSALSHRVAEVCLEARVEGLRADLMMHRAALALAAWEGREVVTEGDVARVADLALSHRRREPPDGPPPSRQRPSSDREPERQPSSPTRQNQPAEGARGEAKAVEQPPEAPVLLDLPPPVSTTVRPAKRNNLIVQGRGKKADRSVWQGPSIRSVMPRGPVSDLAIGATIRAAALRGTKLTKSERRMLIHLADFRVHDRRAPQARLFVFIVDASRSMGACSRLASAKGALLGLLETAYRKRDRVALIVCAGTRAILTVPPTRSARVAQHRLHGLPAAGRTPLAAGLELARQLAQREQRRSSQAISIILLSDGRCNVPHRGCDPVAAVETELGRLVRKEFQVLLIDAEGSKGPLALMPAWGRRFGLSYFRLADLQGRRLADAIRAYLDAPGLPLSLSKQHTRARAAC
jgi:magnesium chelatase subunit D